MCEWALNTPLHGHYYCSSVKPAGFGKIIPDLEIPSSKQ